MKFVNVITIHEWLLLFVIFFMFILFTGMTFNLVTVQQNGGKMPVQIANCSKETDTHKAFTNPSEVNLYFFTDRFSIRDYIIFSLGDVVILIGVVGFVGFWVTYFGTVYLERYLPLKRRGDS